MRAHRRPFGASGRVDILGMTSLSHQGLLNGASSPTLSSPAEFGHLDVALEVARIDEETAHDSRSQAVEALHEVTLAEQTQNWELMTTGWADHGIISTDDWLRDQSAASLRKPQCAVPNDVELSTDKPMIEMAIAIEPLSWGTVVVTGTLVDPDDTNRPSRLASKVASQVVDTIHGQPLPVEARQ